MENDLTCLKCAIGVDSDQAARRLSSLVIYDVWVLMILLGEKRRSLSVCADKQADLVLRCSNMLWDNGFLFGELNYKYSK